MTGARTTKGHNFQFDLYFLSILSFCVNYSGKNLTFWRQEACVLVLTLLLINCVLKQRSNGF